MFYDQMTGGQYEGFVDTFSRSSSHAVHLSRAIASNLRLAKLADELAERKDDETTRIADLGSGPGVALGWILREQGLVREVFASSNASFGTTPPALGPAEAHQGVGGPLPHPTKAPPGLIDLSVWCTDPVYCITPPELGESPAHGGGGSQQETTLPTGAGGCRLEVVGGGRVHFVTTGAIDFLQGCRESIGLLDRVLMKEMVHHVGDYAALGQGLREALRPGTGMALIAGRTPGAIPWFPQAEREFARSCMDTEHICRLLRTVPGLRVATSEHAFDVRLNLADWCALLRGRFMSHLDTIGDDEMERGISEVHEVYGEEGAAPVTFPDRFVFIQVFRDHDAEAEIPQK